MANCIHAHRCNSSLTFVLFAVCTFAPSARAQTSETKASDLWHVETNEVVSQEVRFDNGDTHLVGTLYLPKTGDHLPAVVVLHGAGEPTREDELYRHLREGLPAIGFAVLIYDRRGSGQSSGSLQNISYETLADDGIAGQHAIAKIPRIDPARIGFWGLSQGGWLAVLAAGRSPNAAFAISVSAPLVPAEEQMRFAIRNRLMVGGYSAGDVQEMLDARSAWTGYLRGTNSRDVALVALKNAEAKPWFNLTYMPTAAKLTTDPAHNSYRNEMDDDPFVAATKVKVPLLFIYGDTDPWVPVAQSLEKLKRLAVMQHNFEYAVIPGANHEMASPVGDRMGVGSNSDRDDVPQVPSYFMLMGSWLCRHAGRAQDQP
jgi:uncharacterized protein